MYFPLFVGALCLSLFCYILLCVHFSFAIILKRKRKLVALLLLSCRCIVTLNILWLSLTVPWVGLQFVIVIFPDHTHLLLEPQISHFVNFASCEELEPMRHFWQNLWSISISFGV